MNRPVIVQDHSVALFHCSVSLNMGSLADPVGKEGATTLLFRLMRRSVPQLTPPQIEEKLDRIGASIGIDVNRSTAAFVGGGLKRSFEQCCELLLGMIAQPRFEEAEFERLKKESLAEWTESLDNDSILVRRYQVRTLFEGHPYGRLSAGSPESIERITLDDLKNLYRQLFSVSRLHFAFSGDVQELECLEFCERLRSELPGIESTLKDADDPQSIPGRRLIFVDKPERSQTQIIVSCLGSHPLDEDHTALFVGHTVFGGTFSGRLSHEVRGKRGWSYGAYSSLPYDRKRQAFSMWTFPQASDAAACIQLKLKLLEDLIDKGITARELSAAKKYLVNSHAFSVDTASKRAALALDEKLYCLPPYSEYLDRVRAVSREDVNQAIQKRLSAQDLTLAVVGTASELLESVQQSIEGLADTKLVAFDSRS